MVDEDAATGQPPVKSRAEALVPWRWPLALVALAVVVAATALVFYLETLERADRVGEAVGGLAGAVGERAEAVARGFFSGNVTEIFLSSLPEIDPAGSGLLELAKLDVTEIFTRSDERRILWDTLPLGTVVTEIRVPVTYRYHLRLADPWRLEITDDVCVVYPPAIRPTQPPAIHTEGMRKRVEEGWLRLDGQEQLEALERSITPKLRLWARDPRRVDLVRDESRRTVAEFVRGWLLSEDQWGSGKVRSIRVVFPDEEEAEEGTMRPTITVDG